MITRHLSVALLLLGLNVPVAASNVQFLRDAPVAKMTKEDQALFRKALYAALEENADGAATRWENPDTQASGVLTPLSTFERDGMRCRRIEIANNIQGTSARSAFDLCRHPDGRWRSAAPTPQSK